jgi:hypothetical protein
MQPPGTGTISSKHHQVKDIAWPQRPVWLDNDGLPSPGGCSKWNPVEHRLFSQFTNNWAGKLLRSLAIMLGYIRGTTTTTGLTVKAVRDERIYPKGQKVSWKEVDGLNLTPHEVCPQWNHTVRLSH